MKRNYIIYCTLCAFVLLFSCGNNTNKRDLKSKPINQITYPFTIDLSKTYPKETISLQELFGEMEYVALETKEECLIMRNNGVTVTGNDIFTPSSQGLARFSRDGKFLNQVCRQGRGPGELLSVTNWAVNDNIQEVFVLDVLSKQITVYDFNGKYKRRFKTRGHENYSYSLIQTINDSLLMASSGFSITMSPNKKPEINHPFYIISTIDGRIIDAPLPKRERELTKFKNMLIGWGHMGMVKTENELIVGEYGIDTIYTIGADLDLIPKYIKTPSNAPVGERERLAFAFENDNSAYFVRNSDKLSENGFTYEGIRVDKFSGEIHNTTLYNADIDQNEPTNRMQNIIVFSLPYYHTYEAVQLIELRDAGKLSGKLAEVAAGLTEEDNPVIMIQK